METRHTKGEIDKSTSTRFNGNSFLNIPIHQNFRGFFLRGQNGSYWRGGTIEVRLFQAVCFNFLSFGPVLSLMGMAVIPKITGGGAIPLRLLLKGLRMSPLIYTSAHNQ